MNSLKRKNIRKGIEFIYFTLPAIFFIIIATGIPFIMNIYYSFTDWNGIKPAINFIGFQNFVEIFTQDNRLIKAVLFTFKFTILFVAIVNSLAVLLAVLLDKKIRTKNFLRAAFFLPNVISLIIVGYIWQFIFLKGFDSFNKALPLTFFEWSWLGSQDLAFISVLIVSIWQVLGFYAVIYIAGLQSISEDVMEAAKIDGAHGLKKFISITLPMLMPSITACAFLSMTGGLKVFDILFSLTNGGPAYATTSITYNIYVEAFQQNRYGYATAKSLLFFIAILVITVFQIKFFRSKEVDA